MRPKFYDLAGQKFGKLEVIRRGPNYIRGSKMARWVCKCECGREALVGSAHLRSKVHATKSCGCLKKVAKRIHGMTGSPTYGSWRAMRNRCLNPKDEHYRDYGGRGIKICSRWDSFSLFLEDVGERPQGMTLDRDNNNGDYTPDNCRWATQSTQVRNQRRRKLLCNFSDDEILLEFNRRFKNG